MKYEKTLTINLGDYNNVKLTVSECDSFDNCNKALVWEIMNNNIGINKVIASCIDFKKWSKNDIKTG